MADDFRVALESGGDTKAKNPRSSAYGARQFLKSTFNNLARANKLPWAEGLDDDQLAALRSNPEREKEVAALYDAQSKKTLQAAGLEATDESLYAMWHFGNGVGGGGERFLRASDETPTSALFGPAVLKANPYLVGKTVGQVKENWAKRAGKVRPTQAPKADLDPEAFLDFFAPATPRQVDGGTGGLGPMMPAMGRASPHLSTDEIEASGQRQVDEEALRKTWSLAQLGQDAYQEVMNPWFSYFRRVGEGLDTQALDPAWRQEVITNGKKYLAGYNNEEREELLSAGTRDAYNFKATEIALRRERSQTFKDAGPVLATGALIAAGMLDPTNVAAGAGAMAVAGGLGVGAVNLARQGMKYRSVASAAAEAATGNLAVDTVHMALGTHRSAEDLALSAATGAVLGTIMAPFALRRGAMLLEKDVKLKLFMQKKADLLQASRELGPQATVEQLQARATEIEASRKVATEQQQRMGADATDRMDAPDLYDTAVVKELAPESNEADPDGRLMATDDEAGTFGGDRPGGTTNKAYAPFEEEGHLAARDELLESNPNWREAFARATDGEITPEQLKGMEAGTHTTKAVAADQEYGHIVQMIEDLRKQFMPHQRVFIGTSTSNEKAAGSILSASYGHVITLRKGAPGGMVHTALHEFGHAVLHEHLRNVDIKYIQAFNKEWKNFLRDVLDGSFGDKKLALSARAQRYAGSSKNRLIDKELPITDYTLSRDEYGAEQFVKYITQRTEEGAVSIPQKILQTLKDAVASIISLVQTAEARGFVKPGKESAALFDSILQSVAEGDTRFTTVAEPKARAKSKSVEGEANADLTPEVNDTAPPTAAQAAFDHQYGLDVMPTDTPLARAEKKVVRKIIQDAIAWDKQNPVDPNSVRTLMSVVGAETPGTILASSSDPVARMLSGVFAEHSMGGNGRRSTVAQRTIRHELDLIGNTLRDYSEAYTGWRDSQVGKVAGWGDDAMTMELRQKFDRAVGDERNERLWGRATQPDPYVKRAADLLDEVYGRAGKIQIDTKTPGWGRIPETSVGYAPRVTSKGAFQRMSLDQERGLLRLLSEQFQAFEGFDKDFSEELAKKYLAHARINANGGHEVPMNMADPAAVEYVRQAMQGMGLSRTQIEQFAGRLAAGAPSHTKHRFTLDTSLEVALPDGTKTSLADIFESDQLALLRRHIRRVASEVALTQQGIAGRHGLNLIRKALELNKEAAGPEAQIKKMKAFDQVAAEITGTPVGDAVPQALESAMSLVSAAHLGGLGFAQAMEMMNVGIGMGIIEMGRVTGLIPRMIREIRASINGQRVDNPLLNSMEVPGAEFGTGGYKLQLALDSPSQVFDTYNHRAAGIVARLARASNFANRVVSLHRVIESAQRRAVAERLAVRAALAIRDGVPTKFLESAGVDSKLITRLAPDIGAAAKFDGSGRLIEFDVTQFKDQEAVTNLIDAIHRGSRQVIQEALPGEIIGFQHTVTGKVLTQFRMFPILAMEKQWGRQRNMYGAVGVLARATAVAPVALMIHAAKVQLKAVGRPDSEEYLQQQFTPVALGRAVTNYMSVAGIMPDMIDALSTAAPDELQKELGTDRWGFRGLGSVVPLAGYADNAVQFARDKKVEQFLRAAPLANVPHLSFLSNMLRQE